MVRTTTRDCQCHQSLLESCHSSFCRVRETMASSTLLSASATNRQAYATFTEQEDHAPTKPDDAREVDPSRFSWWSRIFFSFANPVMAVGNSRQLNQDDLWRLERNNSAAYVSSELRKQFNTRGRSVVMALAFTFGRDFFLCGCGSVVVAACRVFAPLVLNRMIDELSSPDRLDLGVLVLWLSALVASRILRSFLQAHINFHLKITILRVTVGLKGLLFAKAMRRSVASSDAVDDTNEQSASNVSSSPADSDETKEKKIVDLSNLFTADMDNFIWTGFRTDCFRRHLVRFNRLQLLAESSIWNQSSLLFVP